ncbi:efflux RND transporter periplasmic adaptor subunit [candidate division KSB1 bacterium]|nr:efflux RND transporter periplasmic adaptor subunit [candidate division KSB1 bacterium]
MNNYIQYKYVLVLSAFLLGLSGCGKESGDIKIENRVTVKISDILKKELSETIHSSGVLQSSDIIKLSFKTGGIVDRIFVHEGEAVKTGQCLASLKQEEMNAQLERARTGYEKAVRDFERAKNLYTDNAVTLQQKQDAESALKLAASTLEIAEFNARYSKIISPGNGKILKQVVEENELVNAGTPIIVFASTDKSWIVKAQIIDKDIVKLQIGDTARVLFDAYPGHNFTGEVSEISEFADPGTGLYELELTLSAKPEKLINGLIAKIDIFTSKAGKYFFVPIDALVEARGDEGFVYTVDENNYAVKVPVKIISVLDEYIAVSGNIVNTRVVTSGAAYLSDDEKTQIITGMDSVIGGRK